MGSSNFHPNCMSFPRSSFEDDERDEDCVFLFCKTMAASLETSNNSDDSGMIYQDKLLGPPKHIHVSKKCFGSIGRSQVINISIEVINVEMEIRQSHFPVQKCPILSDSYLSEHTAIFRGLVLALSR